MEELLNSIEKSLESKNWYAALVVALILPDICGKIDNPNKCSRERYEIWFDKYMRKYYVAAMHGGDCYAIICAALHEFSEDLTTHKARELVDKYKFVTPDDIHFACISTIGGKGEPETITINIVDFCNKISACVKEWLAKSGFNERISSNFIRIQNYVK